MTVQVVILQSAEMDLKALKRYLVKNFGLSVWQASYAQIKKDVNALKKYPLSGVIPDELEQLSLFQFRQVISGMNRIVYEIRDQVIYVHLICDTRRDLQGLLTRRLLRG
jgi:toxin ParE1/3/4